MSTRTDGLVSVSVLAGEIRATTQPTDDTVGKQIAMGDNLYMHVTPAIAKQWISVLETIAESSK